MIQIVLSQEPILPFHRVIRQIILIKIMFFLSIKKERRKKMILIVLGREWIFWPFPWVGQMWELPLPLSSIHRNSTAAKALLHAPCAREGWMALAWGEADFSATASQGGRKGSSLSLQPSWSCADPFVQLETLTRQDCIVVSLHNDGQG